MKIWRSARKKRKKVKEKAATGSWPEERFMEIRMTGHSGMHYDVWL